MFVSSGAGFTRLRTGNLPMEFLNIPFLIVRCRGLCLAQPGVRDSTCARHAISESYQSWQIRLGAAVLPSLGAVLLRVASVLESAHPTCTTARIRTS